MNVELMILSLAFIAGCAAYKVPNVDIEILEKSFRVSIPDEDGVELVAFNVNRHRNFTSFTQGEFSTQVRRPIAGTWSHEFQHSGLNNRQIFYVWTNVQFGRAIYRDISKPMPVCELRGAAQYIDGCSIGSVRDRPTSPTPPSVSHGRDKSTPPTTTHTAPPPPSRTPICKESITIISSGTSACQGELIFEENFELLNDSRWLHEVHAPLDMKDAEFVLYDGRARVADGQLIIKPILWSEYRPDLKVTNSRLDLTDRCTGIHDQETECVLRTSGPFIMPPVVAPRLSTKDSFSFQYGRVEIRAKLPMGDWIVPLLMLEPLNEWYGHNGYESGELRVAMARGNAHLRLPSGKFIDGRILYGGPVLSPEAQLRNDFMVSQQADGHFGSEFHVYSMEWSADSLEFAVDGKKYGTLMKGFAAPDLNARWRRGGPMAPFDRPFFISLGVSVGGFGDFVDNVRTLSYEKPWLNKHPQARLRFWEQQHQWYPTWQQPELLVDYVRVYAL